MRHKLWCLFALLCINLSAASAEVRLGLVGPMTGDQALYGLMMKRGMEAAVNHLNATGGINGQQVKLFTEDDRCDPKEALNVAAKMVNNQVSAVMGHFCSGASLPASDVYADSGIVQISPGSTAPKLTQRGIPTLFRVCGQDNAQGQIAGKHVLEKLPNSRIAVVHDRRTYGKGIADSFTATVEAGGQKVLLQDTVNVGDKDFSALVTRLRAQRIDVLYYGGYHAELSLLLRQMDQVGLKPTVFSGDAMGNDDLRAIAGNAADILLYTDGSYPDTEALRTLKENAAKEQRNLDVYEVYSYAATQVLAQALQQPKPDALSMAQYLKSHTMNTVMGNIEFDQNGDIKNPYFSLKEYRLYGR